MAPQDNYPNIVANSHPDSASGFSSSDASSASSAGSFSSYSEMSYSCTTSSGHITSCSPSPRSGSDGAGYPSSRSSYGFTLENTMLNLLQTVSGYTVLKKKVLTLTTYLIFCCFMACVFQTWEFDNDRKDRQTYRTLLVSTIYETEKNVRLIQVGNLSWVHFRDRMEEDIMNVVSVSSDLNIGTDFRSEAWTFSGSLFFVMTTTATIGYGRPAPKTMGGRCSAIFLFMIGVPYAVLAVMDFMNLLLILEQEIALKVKTGTKRQLARVMTRVKNLSAIIHPHNKIAPLSNEDVESGLVTGISNAEPASGVDTKLPVSQATDSGDKSNLNTSQNKGICGCCPCVPKKTTKRVNPSSTKKTSRRNADESAATNSENLKGKQEDGNKEERAKTLENMTSNLKTYFELTTLSSTTDDIPSTSFTSFSTNLTDVVSTPHPNQVQDHQNTEEQNINNENNMSPRNNMNMSNVQGPHGRNGSFDKAKSAVVAGAEKDSSLLVGKPKSMTHDRTRRVHFSLGSSTDEDAEEKHHKRRTYTPRAQMSKHLQRTHRGESEMYSGHRKTPEAYPSRMDTMGGHNLLQSPKPHHERGHTPRHHGTHERAHAHHDGMHERTHAHHDGMHERTHAHHDGMHERTHAHHGGMHERAHGHHGSTHRRGHTHRHGHGHKVVGPAYYVPPPGHGIMTPKSPGHGYYTPHGEYYDADDMPAQFSERILHTTAIQETEPGDSDTLVVEPHGVSRMYESVTFVVTFANLCVFIFLGALLYMMTEDWTYLESIYFVMTSISTVGFGDYIPANTNVQLGTGFFMLLGLALLAKVISAIKSKLQDIMLRTVRRLESRAVSRRSKKITDLDATGSGGHASMNKLSSQATTNYDPSTWSTARVSSSPRRVNRRRLHQQERLNLHKDD